MRCIDANTPGHRKTHPRNQENRPQDHDRNHPTQRSTNTHNNNNNLRPHKGYTATDRKKQWGKADQTLQEIPKRNMAIWRTDANGQLGKNNQDQNSTHIIGPYANRNETEKGNGQRLYKECKETT